MGSLQENALANISNNHCDIFLNKENVIGVGVGNKITDGIDTGERCLHVLVTEKVPTNELNPVNKVPNKYLGFKTDVIEIGVVKTMALVTRVRPIIFGYSVSPANTNYAGTAGALVYDNNGYYILSNNHVLANKNSMPIGSPILQPGVLDGGNSPNNLVAYLSKFVVINFPTSASDTNPPNNYTDCAIAMIKSNIQYNKQIDTIGGVKGIEDAKIGMAIAKSGRTSGYTTGKVLSTNLSILIDFENGTSPLFKEQILTSAIASPGDSGSLVLNTSNNAIGLVMSGSNQVTVCNPIKRVLNFLNVKLVTS